MPHFNMPSSCALIPGVSQLARFLRFVALLPIACTALHAQVASDFTIVADSTNPEFAAFGGASQLNDDGTVAFYAENPPGSGNIYRAAAGGDPVLIAPGGNG